MYVPAGHGGVRAQTRVQTLRLPGLLCNVELRDWERKRGRKKLPQWAHLWIILANCVHFSLHSTLGLSSKHKEEIKSPAAMLFY